MQHKVELNLENFGKNAEDYTYLQNAITELTAENKKQFNEIKNEKWFTRVFDTITFSKKKSIRMSKQISSVSQAQDLLMEILKRMSNTDVNIDNLVLKNAEDIESLYGRTEKLTEKVKELMDKVISGIDKTINIEELKEREIVILSSLLTAAANSFEETNVEQREFADKILRYLGVAMTEVDLERAIDSIDSNASRKLLFQILLEYGYLNNNNFDFNDYFQSLLDLFDFGNKTIREIEQKIIDIYRLRGAEGFSWFVRENGSEESKFIVEIDIDDHLFEKNTQNDKSDYGCDYDECSEKIIVENKIKVELGEVLRFENKKITFDTEVEVEGTLELINCEINVSSDFETIIIQDGTLIVKACSFTSEEFSKPLFLANESKIVCQDSLLDLKCTFIDGIYGYGSSVKIEKTKIKNIVRGLIFINADKLEVMNSIFDTELVVDENIIEKLPSKINECFDTGYSFNYIQAEKATISNCVFKNITRLYNVNLLINNSSNYVECSEIYNFGKAILKNNNYLGCKEVVTIQDSCDIQNSNFELCSNIFASIDKLEVEECTFKQIRILADNIHAATIQYCTFKDIDVSKDINELMIFATPIQIL
ncbi:hypothetical protein MUA41_00850 [Staphylococcus simulans]|uniref:hypothetical protein n=1 Tax=Staphylococcus simulans TaxID=1286 RepID=UPI0021D1E94D|nr:hypothetical protein [Staphylococcus simulans]UXR38047.1 hypothetical protein MUA41_00850 [Staphylococcus simulans]